VSVNNPPQSLGGLLCPTGDIDVPPLYSGGHMQTLEEDGLPPIRNTQDPIPEGINITREQMEACPYCGEGESCSCSNDEEIGEWNKYTHGVVDRWEKKDKRRSNILEKQSNILLFTSDKELDKIEEKLKLAEKKLEKCDLATNYPSISILERANQEIDKSKYLLGDGWLERGQGGILFSGSGIGKSVIVVQAGILWSVGKPAFETQPNGSLRVLIIQAEDGHNDQILMARMIHHLGLSDEEKQFVGENCRIVTCNDRVDDSFFELLEFKIKEFKPDIVIINPFHSYMSGDVKEEKDVKCWLRQQLSPLLTAYNVGVLIVHHTPKQNYRHTSNWRSTDFMYGMAGAAELTNWPRAVMAVEATEDPTVFQLIAAKRWKRSGWLKDRQYIAYSNDPNVIVWIPATETQVQESSKVTPFLNPMDLFELIPDNGIISPAAWEAAAIADLGVSKKSFEEARGKLRNPRQGYKQLVDYSKKSKVWFLTAEGAARRGILLKSNNLQKYWDEVKKK